jgi:hyaluronoglucosaminidase
MKAKTPNVITRASAAVRRRGAATLTAVAAGLVTAATAAMVPPAPAQAVASAPGHSAAAPTERAAAAPTERAVAPGPQTAATALPPVWPTPQQIQPGPGSLTIPGSVTEVTGAGTDPAALSALDTVLRADGVHQITRVTAGPAGRHAGLVFYVGTPAGNPAVEPELKLLGATGPESLPSGGYVLAAARQAVVLAGADGTGTFYAVQTLRQLIAAGHGPARLRDVVVRDWPATPMRGVIEGFYGPAWTGAQIAGQLRFYGRNKLNTFVYSAKGDPYLRAEWQKLYPAANLASLRQLAATAQAQHVSFTYALSPGLSICYSSATDLSQLEAKDQQLWDTGVRQFALFFDDIGTKFSCPGDTAAFGSSPSPLAAAQAYLLNAFVKGFVDTHPGAGELITVPTDYAGDAPSAYRSVWKASLTPRVLVYWTGVGVIPQTITAAQASATAAEFGHQIVVWDNFPVNDYDPARLFLGPLTGRSTDLSSAVAGFTSNPMQEPAPSEIPLFTTADYTWNPAAYNGDPAAAWQAGIGAAGGRAAAALGIFAADNQSVPRIGTPEAPGLTATITAFWAAYGADPGPAISPALRAAAGRLLAAWRQIAAAPARIGAGTPDAGFAQQAAPWLAKSGLDGRAGMAAVRLLLDQKAGDTRAAAADRSALTGLYARATGIPVLTGQGVFNPFLLRADPSLFTRAVRLYAAAPADYAAAVTAARAAGLTASQVTRSFPAAWDEASSGEYLVIAVGAAADDALYFNTCGWTNPSGLPGGSTPFDLAHPPLAQLPGANYYENGTAATAAQTPDLTTDLAFYAAHGTLPPGVTALPAAAAPTRTCSGSPAP